MNFLHERDSGDCIYSLASVQALGGGHYFFKPCEKSPFQLLEGLVACQPYITGTNIHRGEKVDVDFSTFRRGGIPWGVRLAELHANWVGAKVDWDKPWLTVDPDPRSAGKIIVSKTARYPNNYFPWKALVARYKRDIIFVGLDQEWKAFCARVGQMVPFMRTRNLLEVARLIAGSELLIGNQSSPMAIAEGLKHPIIQEVCLSVPDCIFPRKNAIHCYDGSLRADILGQEFVSEYVPPKTILPTNSSPPGGWKVLVNNKHYTHYCFKALREIIRREMRHQCPTNLDDLIQEYTVSGLELEAIPHCDVKQFERVRRLIEGYASHSEIKLSDSNRSMLHISGT